MCIVENLAFKTHILLFWRLKNKNNFLILLNTLLKSLTEIQEIVIDLETKYYIFCKIKNVKIVLYTTFV